MPLTITEIREQIEKKDELMRRINNLTDNEMKMVFVERLLRKHGRELGLSDKILD